MNWFDALLAIIFRALQVSLETIGPLTILFWLVMVALVCTAHYKRGPRLGTFSTLLGCVFFFFVLWNNPDFGWYKRHPWNGGYAYALVIVIAYAYIPLKIAGFIVEFIRTRNE